MKTAGEEIVMNGGQPGGRPMRVNQAIARAIADEMRADQSVVVFGEDVADAGGPFKTSEGLLAAFGPQRVRDTPISEMGFVGAAVGAACLGLRPVVEIMFMEFLGVALDQVVTEAAKFHFMSGGRLSVPMVVRCSTGSGLGFGLQHSQTLENWLVATPGLKVVTVSDPQSAYGLMRAAIRDDDPVVILEPRALYGTRGLVDLDAPLPTIGSSRTLRRGTDLTVVAMGQTVGLVLASLDHTAASVEVIDLQTFVPWDRPSVLESVGRTGRLVVVEESPLSGGWGSEIVASAVASAFSDLRAGPVRITAPDTPVPYNKELEARRLPEPRALARQLDAYLDTGVIAAPWWLEEGAA
jgi:pyruvate dehydrogenase E1 component beta subunit